MGIRLILELHIWVFQIKINVLLGFIQAMKWF